MFVVFIVIYLFVPRFHIQITKFIILVPFLILQMMMLGLGCGIIICALTTKYRDLQILVSFGMSIWMYATPVVYPISQVNMGWLRTAIMVNPVSMPVEWLRYVFTGVGSIDPMAMASSIVITLVVAVAGIFMFNHVEKTFIDTV